MIGKTISHYKILEKLGEGGMGVVYKAEDTELKREVAIKFLPRQISISDEERERFKIEAQASAALNHPNIATIHAIEEHGDEMFIVMEYIEGRELREIVEADGGSPMPVDRTIDYATQICAGLRAAHEKGITHRDIKPANIMVTDEGLVKIMDFGLAKKKGGPALTKTGSTIGTAAYMSPEQARNEEADHQSDIFSFGAVLYEVCSGRRPFQGDYEAAVLYSLVHEEPEPLPNETPVGLREIVTKCLEKESSDRYQSTKLLLADLQKLRQVPDWNRPADTPVDFEKSIAVLPFEDLSPDKDNAYFSDGLTEEIITDLSHVHRLRVTSRSSAMMFKESKKSLREIGKELNVQYALMGSVMKAGNNVRISAQLLDTSSDSHLWANKYRGSLDDIFDIQEQVSRSIVEALKVKLMPEEEQSLAARPIDNVQAYEFYLRAREEMYKGTEESLELALTLLQNGLDIVGDNVLIYAALGHINFEFYNLGIRVDKKYLDKAESYVDKILKIEPRSSEAYALLGVIKYKRSGVQEAVRQLKRALALNPNDREALFWIVYMYSDAGKTSVARPYLRHLLEIDPLLPINYWGNGWLLRMEGKFEEAKKANKRMYELDTRGPLYRLFYAKSLAYTSNDSDAYALFDQIIQDDPGTIFSASAAFYSYALKGDAQQAKSSVTKKLIAYCRNDEVYSLMLLEGYSLIGEKEKALDWLENAVEIGLINYQFLNQYDPFLENIRSEPRFKQLMKRVKQEWEDFEV